MPQALDVGRYVAALSLLALPLLFVSGVEASTMGLKGAVPGDANATVTMKVVKRRGTPVKVRAVVFRRLDHRCSDGTVRELSVRLRRSRISKVGITSKYTFFELLSPPSGLPAPNDANQLAVTGKLRRSARVVRGTVDSTVRLAPVPPAIANACISVKRNYVARRTIG